MRMAILPTERQTKPNKRDKNDDSSLFIKTIKKTIPLFSFCSVEWPSRNTH